MQSLVEVCGPWGAHVVIIRWLNTGGHPLRCHTRILGQSSVHQAHVDQKPKYDQLRGQSETKVSLRLSDELSVCISEPN